MHRHVLALAGMTMVIGVKLAWCAEAVAVDLNVGLDPVYLAETCWPLPPSYPRGWEIVIHTPCPPGYYLPNYFHPARYHYWHSRVGPIHRRPYLQPGWWW